MQQLAHAFDMLQNMQDREKRRFWFNWKEMGRRWFFLSEPKNQTQMTPYCVKLQWILKILCERLVWILELPERRRFPDVDLGSKSFVCPFWSCQVYLWFGVSKSLHVTASPSRNDVWNIFLTEYSLIPMNDKKSYMMSKWSFNSCAKSIEFKF